jgi:hypothetical protein
MPSFNLQADFWTLREWTDAAGGWTLGKPVNPPSYSSPAAIQVPKQSDPLWFKYLQPAFVSPIYYWGTISRQLLLPLRTFVSWPVITSGPGLPLIAQFTIIRCPHDREQWYYTSEFYDIGRGHPNEFRVAAIIPIPSFWSGVDPPP